MASLPRATRRNYTSVVNILSNKGGPLSENEKNVFMNDVDCAALVEREDGTGFDGFVEDLLTFLPCRRLNRVSSTSSLLLQLLLTCLVPLLER